MRTGKVALLLLILAFGAVVETTWFVRRELALGPVGCRVLRGKFYGPSFSFDEEARVDLPAGASVDVSNAFGAVRVMKGEAKEVRITLRKVVFRSGEAEARAFAARIHPLTRLDGTVLRVSTNREEVEADGDGRDVGFETHLEIAVPPDSSVIVRNEHGSVDVRDVAQADASASFEALHVEAVTGSVRATSRHGDATVSAVGGALELSAQHGDVAVRDVTGKASIKVEHGDATVARVGDLLLEAAHGDVRLEDIRGSVTLRGQHAAARAKTVSGRLSMATSHAGLEVDGVQGAADLKADHGGVTVRNAGAAVSVDASFDDVSLSQVAGPVEVNVVHGGMHALGLDKGGRIRSQGDDVVLEGFSGSVWIETQRGSVQLVPSGAIKEALTVSTRFGSIDIRIPSGSGIDLDAQATEGDVTVNLPGFTTSESGERRVKGSYQGGGIPVKLSADHGEIHVQAPEKVADAKQ